MSKLRQLYQEVEKKLKAVEEGSETFNSTLERISSSANSSQKEKLEAELKKEIKKLQRLREALKPYLTNPDIRDKKSITDARKSIEQLMETYKQFERDNKTKAFSNEGLALVSKIEPHCELLANTRRWIHETQQLLKDSINLKEAEIERNLPKRTKKPQQEDDLDSIQRCIETYQEHYDRLELLLRGVENQTIPVCDKFKELKDLLDMLVDSTDSAEYIQSSIEQIYEDLNLSKLSSSENETVEGNGSKLKKSQMKKNEQKKGMPNVVATNKPPAVLNVEKKTQPKLAGNSKDSAWRTPAITPKPDILEESKMEQIEETSEEKPLTEESPNLDPNLAKELFEKSFQKLPRQMERERSKLEIVKHPHPTHPAFPNKPLFNITQQYSKLELDTLFFIFYHQHGTYQQYLAAIELKKKNWRFHKRYQTWFQRLDEPRLATQEKELGTYIYFDYETGWCQRKRTEFTFEFAYLEDELSF
jgi:CCR4-NOT transcription complex subunit 3